MDGVRNRFLERDDALYGSSATAIFLQKKSYNQYPNLLMYTIEQRPSPVPCFLPERHDSVLHCDSSAPE